MNAAGSGSADVVVACVKWTSLRPDIDPLDGAVHSDERRSGVSDADRAAVELALQLGDARSAQVVVLCAGPADAEPSLRELLAAGAARVLRIDADPERRSDDVARLLASAITAEVVPAGASLLAVCCGDLSPDRGSGSVPAFLAHELSVVQALGLIEVEVTQVGSVRAVRRLDGARRERLTVPLPAVLSVEGAVAELRRAPLSAVLGAERSSIEVLDAAPALHHDEPRRRPWRPRPRLVPAPQGERALERIVALTGALVERTPPRTIELDPDEAAEEILEQLRVWGYLDEPGPAPPADVVQRADEPPLLG